MAMTIAQIKQLVRELELTFWVSPAGDAISIPYFSDEGRQRIDVIIQLHDDNSFLQFTAVPLFAPNADDASVKAILDTLNTMNCARRFIKLAYDADSYGVRAFGDFWIKDGEMTPLQFAAMLNTFGCCVFDAHRAVIAALDADLTSAFEQELPF